MLAIVQHLSGRPWAIQGELAAHVRGLVAKDGIGGLRHLAELRRDAHATDGQAAVADARSARSGMVGVVPVVGLLTQRGDIVNSAMTRSTTAVADQVDAMAADPGIAAIVLEIASPGGEVHGVPEAFSRLRAAAKRKPLVAAVNSYAGSAAYWLASAADEIWVTPSGSVGSIGVYTLHVDYSSALADAGEVWSFISAGKYKVEGNGAEPLGEEARASFQANVDSYYRMFVRDVAKGRGVPVDAVRDGFGEGRMVLAEAAVAASMATGVATLGEAIARAAQLARERANRTASARAQAEVGAL